MAITVSKGHKVKARKRVTASCCPLVKIPRYANVFVIKIITVNL